MTSGVYYQTNTQLLRAARRAHERGDMYGSMSTRDKTQQEADALLPKGRRASFTKRSSSKRVNMTGEKSVLDEIMSGSESRRDPKRGPRRESKERNDVGSRSYSFVYTLLNHRSRQWQALAFKSFISTIILTDLCIFVLSTDATFNLKYGSYMYIIEGLVSCIFLIEYVARLVTISESKHYRKLGPIMGRIHYLTTFGAILDFLATIPFFLELLTGYDLPTLTYLRFFRLFRILKTEGFVRAIDAVYRVIYYNRQILYVAIVVCFFLIFLTAVLLYYLRPPESPENEENFSSILATLYLSTLMLTGQGGPDGDLPWYTKCVVLLTSVFSVAMFAIPASMLTWGFEAEAARCAKLSWRRAKKKAAESRSSNSESSSSSDGSNSSGHSTDEEYFKIIAGEEEDENESDAAKVWLEAQKKSFQKVDVDNSGTISFEEYLGMPGAKDAIESQVSQMQLDALEKRVNENCEKLDRILELLGDQRSTKGL